MTLNDFIRKNKHQISRFTVIVQRGDELAVCKKQAAPAWAEFGWVVVHEGDEIPEPKGAKRSRGKKADDE